MRTLCICISLALVLDLVYWNVKDRFRKDLVLTFIDVGHGDSILVELPGGKRMLVDGEGQEDDRFDIGQQVIAPFLWGKKIRRIDYLVLTHPDPDHLKGLSFIASLLFTSSSIAFRSILDGSWPTSEGSGGYGISGTSS
jgi:competence protein ComEC